MSRYLLIVMILVVGLSCKKAKKYSPPEETTLLFPLKDQVCTEGAGTSASKTTILFTWNVAANADSYELFVRNLITNAVISQTSTKSSTEVSLSRDTPYAWYVVSKSDHMNNTSKSQTWKFYSSGAGIVSHPPFPADVVAPAFGQSVSSVSGKLMLDWSGADSDNDLVSYDIYFGTTNTPALLKTAISDSQLADVVVSQGVKYFWKVVSRDAKGNTSESEIFQFSVR